MRPICKFGEDQYLEWGTVTDSPMSYMMTRKQMVEYCGDEKRVERADLYGTSWKEPTSLQSQVSHNRAGENETSLSIPELIKEFTK